MSIFDLTGRVAVVTGGNGGIGLGIAQALGAAGCNVSIWGRNADKNKAAAASMSKGPGKVDSRICDVTDPASVPGSAELAPETETTTASSPPRAVKDTTRAPGASLMPAM